MKRKSLLVTCSLFLTACNPTTISTSTNNAPVSVNKTELLTLVNQARSNSRSCGNTSYSSAPALQWNSLLEQAAQIHSNDMNQNNFFSHTGSNGSDVGDRLSQVGYNVSYHGENIANGYPTEQSVIDGWLESAGHCRNIMNPNYTQMGVATAGSYWTQVFAQE